MVKLAVKKGNIGNFFDSWYKGALVNKGIEINKLKDVLNEVPVTPKNILDYGCGQGDLIPLLSEKFPDAQITGIEVSKNGVEAAKQLFPEYKFLLYDGENIPFPDNSFDLVFSSHVLDAVWNLEKAFAEISRVLKKGGILCVVMPCGNKGSFEERITCLVRGGKEASVDGRTRFFYSYAAHIRRLESSELIELLAENNVKIYKEIYGCQFWGAINWISKSSIPLLNDLFDYKKSVNAYAKIKLIILKIVFIFLFIIVKPSIVNFKKIKNSSKMKKIILICLIIFKPISVVFSKVLTFFALLEWQFRKTSKNGSAQYLLFLK